MPMFSLPPRSAGSLLIPASQPTTSYTTLPARFSFSTCGHRHRSSHTIRAQAFQPDPRRRAPTEQTPWSQTSSYNAPPPPGAPYQPYEEQYAPPPTPPPRPPPPGGSDGNGGLSNTTKAMIAAAFIMGVGAGTWFESEATFTPQNVASTQIIDRRTPNSEVCMANGYSSMVFDQRIFVSFNPFNVYVTQPEVKPGCVLRRSNVNVLESRGLVQSKEVNACKSRMNTFAFVGDLDNSPEVSCVYHSEDAENQFLKDPSKSVLGDGVSGGASKAQ